MLRNYFTIAWRNLLLHKVFSLINVLGLSVGMAACLMITLFVADEFSFDRYHDYANHIYRIVEESQEGRMEQKLLLPSGLIGVLRKEFPEIVAATRLGRAESQFKFGTHVLKVRLLSVDPEAFKVFSFPLLMGDSATALVEPNSIVISESLARTYFQGMNPIGVVLQDIPGYGASIPFRITGVMRDIPAQSHFHVDVLRTNSGQPWAQEPFNHQVYTSTALYLRLHSTTNAAALERKFAALYQKYAFPENSSLHLQALTDIHLYSNLTEELEPNSDIRYVHIFSVTALFILAIACINFVNLSTARSLRRAREIGVRKVLGAGRAQLIRQLLGESALLFVVALLLGATLVQACLPWFNNLLDRELSLRVLEHSAVPWVALILLMFICLLASAYPAFFLSNQHPVFVLKGVLKTGSLNTQMRRVLVVVQFSASVTLAISTAIIYNQLGYIRHKRLGFNQEQLLVIVNGGVNAKGQIFKQELLRFPEIINVSEASWYPGKTFGASASMDDPKHPGQKIALNFVDVDYDYLRTLQIPLASGGDFDAQLTADLAILDSLKVKAKGNEFVNLWAQHPIILNEAAVKNLALANPIGQKLSFPALQGKVIGVVKDFNGLSLHLKVPSVILRLSQGSNCCKHLVIRVRPENIASSLEHVQGLWKQFHPDSPLEFEFVNEVLQRLYQSEQRLGRIFGIFSALAISIACLGLFGLAAFMAEQRTKEVGIRKVLGASISDIVGLLSGDVLKLVLVANLIAWPLAWWAMRRWLEHFAYRTEIHWWLFLIVGVGATSVALLTLSIQTIKVAKVNPVKALRYE